MTAYRAVLRWSCLLIGVLFILPIYGAPARAQTTPGTTTLRINSGGGTYIDSLGRTWLSDRNFAGGSSYSTTAPISGTTNQTLYKTERWGGSFSYAVPVTNGLYDVTVHLAEIFWSSSGQRIFDIDIEGIKAEDNIDIFGLVGANKAYTKTIRVGVNDGLLNVLFTKTKDNAKISGIEIIPASIATPTPTPTPTATPTVTPTPSALFRLNSGGTSYSDTTGQVWSSDANFSGGSTYSTSATISGTTNQQIYKTERFGSKFSYNLPVANGSYTVVLHFAEIWFTSAGQRIFDVDIEGVKLIDDMDVFAVAGGKAALIRTFPIQVSDGMLNIVFAASKENAKISAIEVLQGTPTPTPTPTPTATPTATPTPSPTASPAAARINAGGPAYLDGANLTWSADGNFLGGNLYSTTAQIAQTVEDPLYQTERFGTSFSYNLPVSSGPYSVRLHFAEIFWTSAGKRLFDVLAEGLTVVDDLDIWAQVGSNTALVLTVPVKVTDGVLNLQFISSIDAAKVSAIEVLPDVSNHTDPYLHVVIQAPTYLVDYDSNGSESVILDGTGSHTHEPGKTITSYVWKDNGVQIGVGPVISTDLSTGAHTIDLTIGDSNTPSRYLSGSAQIPVYSKAAVGGVMAEHFQVAGSVAAAVDTLPAAPGVVEVLPNFDLQQLNGKVGNSPYTSNVVTRMFAKVNRSTPCQLTATGGEVVRLFLNGAQTTIPATLPAGVSSLEYRVGVSAASALPAKLLCTPSGGSSAPLDPSSLTHDESALKPFLNSMPSAGPSAGGNTITIQGIGFFQPLSVNWGGTNLSGNRLTASQNSISLSAPPGAGTVSVTVQTPNGISNAKQYTYDSNVNGVSFNTPVVVATPNAPTQGAWGPDGRFYVGTINGSIVAYTFDNDLKVVGSQSYSGVSGLGNSSILGIAFNPLDPPSPVRIYVTHSKLYAQGGACFTGSSPYPGQVSMLEGPNFSNVFPKLVNLPVSNHDHGINGMTFDNTGKLLVAVGGNTNAGIPSCALGSLPESPLSAAVIQADLSDPAFNGSATYIETATGNSNDDQVFGGLVDVAPGVTVKPYAVGFRNPFDIVYSLRGQIYLTDNGADDGFGAASTGPNTVGPDPNEDDEVNLVYEGFYYGHPNRNRGRKDARQNVYAKPSATAILGGHTPPLTTLLSSSNGIDEYRSGVFQGAMKGNILVQRWNNSLYSLKLDSTGRIVQGVSLISNAPPALDIVSGPAGSIISVNYTGNQILTLKPSGLNPSQFAVFDVLPWRALNKGGTTFIIGGSGFGTQSSTTVTFGGTQAVLTSVTANQIRGTIPPNASPTGGLIDVVVSSNGQSATLEKAFRYVYPAGTGKGTWRSLAGLPTALGQVAGGVINGVLYLVGEGDSRTFAYDPKTDSWSILASRTFPGHHHAAEVINQKLYLFGGINNGAEAKVQIFNPATNSWTPGADIPVGSGSASSAYIGGKVYYAGGITTASTTTTTTYVYNVATNSWTTAAPMPVPRNNAASGTDGSKFYIFGGRGPGSGDGNIVAEGFDDVQIYDPATNSWLWSGTPGSGIPPLPQKRGGTGKAAYFRGEFFIMGGETTASGTGQTANNVYSRVDVFNPIARTWRLETPMSVPRQGIFPIVQDSAILVVGGGTSAGFSSSNANENFLP